MKVPGVLGVGAVTAEAAAPKTKVISVVAKVGVAVPTLIVVSIVVVLKLFPSVGVNVALICDDPFVSIVIVEPPEPPVVTTLGLSDV